MFNSDGKQKGPRKEEFGISCQARPTVHCGKGLSLARSCGAPHPQAAKRSHKAHLQRHELLLENDCQVMMTASKFILWWSASLM